MRILKLRLLNLNSLQGEWSVDFEHPDFISDGIFAIVGPTGAGKSTLLDAVCLGLYGRTPRLKSVSANQNEIMSRQTGECFAEVMFQTQSGRYRCHWSQKKSHGRANGNLQSPQHEVSNAVTGEIVASGIRDVAKTIQKLTGMDFEQFTRSMLLAQGSFAAFLKASADERSGILEQITGTHIYTEISLAVHERKTEEEQSYKTLNAAQENIVLLEPAQEEALQKELAELEEQLNKLHEEANKNQQLIQQLNQYKEAQHEQQQLKKKHELLQENITNFALQRQRLEYAEEAKKLKLEYTQLKDNREQSERLDTQIANDRKLSLDIEVAHHTQQDKQLKLTEQLSEATDLLMKQQPLIETVKNLDQQYQNVKEMLQEIEQAHQEHQKNHQQLQSEATQNQRALEEATQSQEQLQTKIRAHQSYQQLPEQLPVIKKLVTQVNQHHQEHQTHKEQLTKKQQQLALLDLEQEEHTKKIAIAQSEIEQTRAIITDLESHLKASLKTKTLAELRQDQLLHQQNHMSQSKGLSYLSEIEEHKTHLKKAQQTTQDFSKKRTEITQKNTESDHLLQLTALEIAACSKEIELQQRIKGLEADRDRLQAGEPCPLCGAKEHPYRKATPPEATQQETHLKQLLTRQSQETQQLAKQQTHYAKIETELEHAKKQTEQTEQHLKTAIENLNTLCIAAHWPVDISQETLKEQHEATSSQLQVLSQQIETAQKQQDQLQGHYGILNAQQNSSDALMRDNESKLQHHQKTQNEIEQGQSDVQTTRKALATSEEELEVHLAPYKLSLSDLEHAIVLLTEYAELFKTWQNRLHNTENTLTACKESQKHYLKNLAKSDDENKKLTDKQQLQSKRCQILSQERHELFGNQDPQTVLQQLNEKVAETRTAYEQQQKAVQQSREAVTKNRMALENLINQLKQLQNKHTDLQQCFINLLHQSPFANEAEYLQACLTEDDYLSLKEQATALDHQLTENKAKQEQAHEALQKVLTQLKSDPEFTDVEQLRVQQSEHEEKKQTLAKQQGGLTERLQTNAAMKVQNARELEKIAVQRQELERWKALHGLIGSSSGKKFRTFAQGLTFDVMIFYANQQLQKMSNRYLLQRESPNSLDLSILDNYQGGEIRSTKNLSGGESFIVSLALALGLSHMASQNVSVDSLFLDEGFGTLDEEALDTALETLSSLHQENKLIGIISHVQALKERMGTQIKVLPRNNGTSRLTGPGCKAC